MLTVWTQPSGYNLGTFQEQVDFYQLYTPLGLPLPTANDAGVTYQVISGALPVGLYISGNHILGAPSVVSQTTEYTFCIRASLGSQIADRTFTMFISGNNGPEFTTPVGDLAVGVHQQLYALDNSYVEYQIQAVDLNTALGANLKYTILSGDGNLPPGLTLSESGLISGLIIPSLIITPSAGNGDYDTGLFDQVAYDWGNPISTDGFDSYQYDDVDYGYNRPAVAPKSLNANYQFKVTVTDGINYAQRIFKIFVVGTDEFRADSTSLDGFAGNFTADSTYLRTPVWLTNPNLGIWRANNYITVPIALYDRTNVIFRVEATNTEIYSVAMGTLTDNNIGNTTVTIVNATAIPQIGQYFTLDNYVNGATEQLYKITAVQTLGNQHYRLTINTPLLITIPDLTILYLGTLSQLPPGTAFDINTGELYGRVPYQPQITTQYTFTIAAVRFGDSALDEINSYRTFNIIILGSVTSQITWNSPSNLGTIPANYICTLNISASTTVPNAPIVYTLASGSLPTGITLTRDGELVGTPNQFYNLNSGQHGLTLFDSGNTTFDHNTSSIDRVYTFSVRASDTYGYSAVAKQFTLTISAPNTVTYSNVTTRPFLNPNQRILWQNFINDSSIFNSSSIYRPSDSNFGVQSSLSMLVYAGIQTEVAAAYVGAIGLNTKRKRFQFSSIKKATASDTIGGTTVYEVIYLQMIDPLETNGKHLPLSIKSKYNESETITVDDANNIWEPGSDIATDYPTAIRPDYNITIDSTGYNISTPNTNTYYPNSISNWQIRISQTQSPSGQSVLSERNYLPLWMRTIQTGSKQELGYTLAVPICFCKPGTADKIIAAIEQSGFDFKSLDYEVDRFTISAVLDSNNHVLQSDKYLVFKNDRITV